MQRPGPRNRILNRDPRNPKVSTSVSSWLNFTPLSLNPVVWLDAADTSTITESSGFVSQWDDKSGNGYDVVQATGANQPATGSATINGLNVLSFDGSNDRMQNLNVPSSSRPHTYVIVMKETASITTTKSLVNASTGTNGLALFLTGTNPTRSIRVFWAVNNSFDVLAGPNITTTDVNICYLSMNGENSEIGSNSTINTINTTGTTRASGIRIGVDANNNGEFFNGQIGEVFYFNSALTTNQRLVLFAYLRNKWGPI
jgi:hypothetical protein